MFLWGTGADDETRTRDPHLGKVMRYQLRYIRMRSALSSLNARTNLIRIPPAVTNRHVTAILRGISVNYVGAIWPAVHSLVEAPAVGNPCYRQ